ncbi:unnamed protein product [Ectocarpus sp. 6 AP-2014]
MRHVTCGGLSMSAVVQCRRPDSVLKLVLVTLFSNAGHVENLCWNESRNMIWKEGWLRVISVLIDQAIPRSYLASSREGGIIYSVMADMCAGSVISGSAMVRRSP